MVFTSQVPNPSVSQEIVCVLAQDHLFPRKIGAWHRKPTVPQGKPKKNFLEFGRVVSRKLLLSFSFSLGKFCFSAQNHRVLLGSVTETNFSPGKTKNNKHLFGVWPYGVPKDCCFLCFLVFPKKKLVFDWKGTVLPLSVCSRRT